MAPPSSDNGEDHQGSNDEVKCRGEYSIVESLRQGSSLTGDFDDVNDTCKVGDEQE